jgi:hypothetical protein
VPLSTAQYPSAWVADSNGLLYPRGSGDVLATIDVGRRAEYDLWLGGSFRDRLRAYVDGQRVADLRHFLNNGSLYTRLGRVALGPGRHTIRLRIDGPDLHPGSGGYPLGLGPLVMSTTTAADTAVTFIDAKNARSLCGKRLDWIEAVRA